MDKLSREEVKELVEKISYGMGSDEEVSEWIQKIMDSVPNRNVVEAIMSGPNASIEEILDKLYTGLSLLDCLTHNNLIANKYKHFSQYG